MADSIESDISRPGLHKRFNKRAVAFLEACLEEVLTQTLKVSSAIDISLLQSFNRVCVWDSCGWKLNEKLKKIFPGCGGSGSKAGCKLQFCFDFLSSKLVHVALTNGIVPDQKYGKKILEFIQAGDLFLFDLGYFSVNTLAKITQAGAFFLSRFIHNTALYVENNGKFLRVELLQLLSKHKTYLLLELPVFLKKGKIPCRLVAVKLPEKERSERLRKLHQQAKKQGKVLSKERRMLASWNIFVTNVSAEIIPPEKISSVYRLRWSIELLFKQFKSTLKIHSSNHANQHRFRSEVSANLILAVLLLSVYGQLRSYLWKQNQQEVSIEKFFKFFKNNAYLLFEAVFATSRLSSNIFCSLISKAIKLCIKAYQKSRLSSLQLLSHFEQSHPHLFTTNQILAACGLA